MLSRHTIECRAAQEAGVPHRGYIDRKNENVIFTLLYLGDPLSDWNQIFATELSASKGNLRTKFEGNRSRNFRDTSCKNFDFFSWFFFFVFSHTCKNCYKTQTRTPIALTFGTQKGSPKANPSMKFSANSMMVRELCPIIRVKQDRFVVMPTG